MTCRRLSPKDFLRTVPPLPFLPLQYPGNYYSNKRWCCGDAGSGSAHMDMSVWAFEKLASKGLGVIGISFRQVPCDYTPATPAPTPSNPSPPEAPWAGAKRPDEQVYVKRFDSVGQPQGAVSTVDDASQAAGQPIVPISQLYQDGTFTATASSGASSPSSSGGGGGGAANNGCTDAKPSDGTTCQQQKDWGKCNENWIISGNYCRATCGRCSLAAAASSSSSSSSTAAAAASCADAQPSSGTCQQQKDWGNCEEDWIKSGSYCQITCGHCDQKVASFEG